MVYCGLWVIVMDQSRFINCKKCTIRMGGVDNGGGYACVEAEAIRKYQYFPLHFAADLKPIYNNKFLIEISIFIYATLFHKDLLSNYLHLARD